MPELKIVEGSPDTFTLNNSGVIVSIKRKASASDHDQSINGMFGEGYSNRRDGYRIYLRFLAAALITSWDATRPNADGEQVPIPVSPQTLRLIEDDKDYEQLLDEAEKRVVLRGAADPDGERNFETSSPPSSLETNSSPESSPDSSLN